MRRKYIKPSIIHYNLLLRAVRECGVGTERYSRSLLLPKSEKSISGTFWQSLKGEIQELNQDLLSESGKPIKSSAYVTNELQQHRQEEKSLLLQNDPENISIRDLIIKKGISRLDLEIPDLLSNRLENLTSVIKLGSLDKPEHRLALLGGVPGILKHMKADSAQPDIKTFSLLLPSIPPSKEAELDLINTANANSINLDIGFFNQLIKRRALRHDSEGCWEIFYYLQDYNIKCDEKTFGCLAMSCKKMEDGVKLIGYIQVMIT